MEINLQMRFMNTFWITTCLGPHHFLLRNWKSRLVLLGSDFLLSSTDQSRRRMLLSIVWLDSHESSLMPASLYALMKRAFIEAPCFVQISLRTASSVLIGLYFCIGVPRSSKLHLCVIPWRTTYFHYTRTLGLWAHCVYLASTYFFFCYIFVFTLLQRIRIAGFRSSNYAATLQYTDAATTLM